MLKKTSEKLKEYEQNKVFHNTWNAKLPWPELVTSEDGKVHQVKCKFCSTIKEKDKLLTVTLDMWLKIGCVPALLLSLQ
jgi:hypothetical protein